MIAAYPLGLPPRVVFSTPDLGRRRDDRPRRAAPRSAAALAPSPIRNPVAAHAA